jgi:hypothetical protein
MPRDRPSLPPQLPLLVSNTEPRPVTASRTEAAATPAHKPLGNGSRFPRHPRRSAIRREGGTASITGIHKLHSHGGVCPTSPWSGSRRTASTRVGGRPYHERPALKANEGARDATDHEGVSARPSSGCARCNLVSCLAGCAAIDELKEAFLRWVESERLPSGRDVLVDESPEANLVVPAEKTPKESSKRRPQPKDTARKLQRPQTVVLPPKKPPIPDSTEVVRPEGTEGQSAPSQPAPLRLRSPWPEAPAPGTFPAQSPSAALDSLAVNRAVTITMPPSYLPRREPAPSGW